MNRPHDRVLRQDEIHSLLLVELTRLGDALSTLPAVEALAARFPAARIHLFVDDRFAPLIGAFDLNVVVHGIRASDSAVGILSAMRRARRLSADVTCSMSPAKRNVAVALGSGAPRKAGYLRSAGVLVHFGTSRGVEARGFSRAVPVFPPGNNIELRALRVSAALGITEFPPHVPLRVKEESILGISARLLERGDVPSRPYVVIHPFSGWTYRSWRLPNYIRLANMLRIRYGMDTLFLFARDEQRHWVIPENVRLAGDPPRAFVSDDLLESAVAIKGARLFIGNDSGPLHLAACLGVPRVGLFGPSSPALTAPLAGRGTHLYRRVECSPCRQHGCVRPTHTCMDLLSIEEVYNAVCREMDTTLSLSAPSHA
ncbi:MAG TPA: glycosyltransferase family 9 protein [Bacteroidota bacterium]|nr:glycosyltransferase family 9 protein [Bacteroidota bacterium]